MVYLHMTLLIAIRSFWKIRPVLADIVQQILKAFILLENPDF